MTPIEHIQNALSDLEKEMHEVLADQSVSLTEKDNRMLPIVRQKKVLEQTLSDLIWLKENPPAPNQPCGISKYREE